MHTTFDIFRQYVEDLRKKELRMPDHAFAHGVIGIAGEAGELVDILKRQMAYGKEPDEQHVLEELGDLFHYMVYLMVRYGFTIDDIINANMEKLDKRYPNGYSDKDALERKDKHEHITTA